MAGELAQIIGAAAQRYGVDPQVLTRIGQIESGLNPRAQNPKSSAAGLFQFIDSTAQRYGLGNKLDPAASADAAARLTRDNAALLSQRLGRMPTGPELYLAHQQGAGGALKLLSNPGGDAAATVGADRVSLNGGRPGMTNADFAGLWANKFSNQKMTMPAGTNGTYQGPPAPGSGVPSMVGAPMPTIDPAVIGRQNAAGVLQNEAVQQLFAQNAQQQAEQERVADEKARRRALFGSVAGLYG